MSDVNQTPDTNEAPATISILDLANVVKIIDYAADQGAFKGWTVIEQVAGVRSKINAFVEAAQAAQEAETANTEGGDAAPVAETPAEVPAEAKPVAKKVTKKATKAK
jgi:hypothetical protein